MPAKLYRVDLTNDEQTELDKLTRQGKVSARKMKRAQILLKASLGWRDEAIMQPLDISRSTGGRTRRRFVGGGAPQGLHKNPRPRHRRKLTGHAAAQLVAPARHGRPRNP